MTEEVLEVFQVDDRKELAEALELPIADNELELIHVLRPFELDRGEPPKKTVIIVTGISGSGKDEMVDTLTENFEMDRAVTMTTRPRRHKFVTESEEIRAQITNNLRQTIELQDRGWHESLLKLYEQNGWVTLENKDDYIWLDFPPEDPAEKQQYFEGLKAKIDFAEYDDHMDHFYGLPNLSLHTVLESGKIPIARVDATGAKTLQDSLIDRGYNVLIIGVIPDTVEITQLSIAKRVTGKDTLVGIEESLLKKIVTRVKAAKVELAKYVGDDPIRFNYIIRNTRNTVGENEIPGLAVAQNNLIALMHRLEVGVGVRA